MISLPQRLQGVFGPKPQDINRFSPQRWIDAAEVAAKAGMELVILDSATHEWLEQKERINKSINN